MNFIEFPDVSNVGQGVMNLTGVIACIAKATEGNSFTDPQYYRNKAQMIGKPFSGYHWVDTVDIDLQADYCFNVVGPKTGIMLDAEALGATVPHLVEFTRHYRARGGIVWGVYLPKWYWQKIGSPDLTPLKALGLVLISSNYVDMSQGFIPYGGMTPTIFQFTDNQYLNGKACDFNRFQGTLRQLEILFNGGKHMSSNFLATYNSVGTYQAGVDVVFLSDGFQYRGVGKGDMHAIGALENMLGAPVVLDDLPTFLAVCGVPWNAPNPSDPAAMAQTVANAVVTEEAKRLATPAA